MNCGGDGGGGLGFSPFAAVGEGESPHGQPVSIMKLNAVRAVH